MCEREAKCYSSQSVKPNPPRLICIQMTKKNGRQHVKSRDEMVTGLTIKYGKISWRNFNNKTLLKTHCKYCPALTSPIITHNITWFELNF